MSLAHVRGVARGGVLLLRGAPLRPRPRVAARRALTSAVVPPPDLGVVETVISAVATATGAPWYAAITATALSLRVALIPTVLYQLRETRKLVALRPRLMALRASTAKIEAPGARAWALAKGVWAECRASGVQPLAVFGMPFVQIPALVGLVIAIRGALQPGAPLEPEFRSGGAGWFKDLTSRDATGMLPLISLFVLAANFQLSFSGRSVFFTGLRDVFQLFCLAALPFYAELPAGVFMYWIPNSAYSFVQTVVVRRTAANRAMRGLSPAAGGALVSSGSLLARGGGVLARGVPGAAGAAPAAVGAQQVTAGALPTVRAGVTKRELELRQTLGCNPSDVRAHVALSKLLIKAKRPNEAVAHLWPAVQAADRQASGPLRFQLALALALQGQYDVAEPLLEQCLQLEPNFGEALLCLCQCQEALGKIDAARATLGRVATLRPDLRSWCKREVARLKAP